MLIDAGVPSARAVLVAVGALFLPACASRPPGTQWGAVSASAGCVGAAEVRVVNRSNVLLEFVEVDRTTRTMRVIGVVEPGVSHFPARGEAEITYVLRGLEGAWLTSDRVNEPGSSMFAVERRCR